MVLDRATGRTDHRRVAELPALLGPGDLMVVNDTRVLPARLRARRATGGRVELLLLHPSEAAPGVWAALARPAGRLRPDEVLRLVRPDGAGAAEPAPTLRVVRIPGDGRVDVLVEGAATGAAAQRALLASYGEVPLPPYIHAPLDDPERYQTVYARVEGSAAAPTAGLHFTPALLEELRLAGIARTAVTLHVGVGTFRPVAEERPEAHRMHAEWCEVPPETARAIADTRRGGRRVVAIGTTAVRTLESRADEGGQVHPGSGWTDLYILPGWRFRVIDALLTNFHLPRSTLLMLVCAFAGRERVLAAYREAARTGYRFYSFGDAMLIL